MNDDFSISSLVMDSRRYCGDCYHYIPGGVYPNCIVRRPKNNKYKSTCPIALACADFKDKSSCRG